MYFFGTKQEALLQGGSNRVLYVYQAWSAVTYHIGTDQAQIVIFSWMENVFLATNMRLVHSASSEY